ncbi:DUF4097 family beta strand repeat-containing protein [Bailinhaonella thermotolerans]|uniref:DUF4097 domain-containing protein n=1 Tax=Bailinhaonella thermotolerans TaxID=1070861 RepID=A0A3A4ACF4_9ACTN|nr:DUF4097 family beta strand repeat-containing protein [Bailinhaonella thermotolerans]RJL23233.1 hypothetical protein D5H75_33220 [Bailinhaonella thermotolerans]
MHRTLTLDHRGVTNLLAHLPQGNLTIIVSPAATGITMDVDATGEYVEAAERAELVRDGKDAVVRVPHVRTQAHPGSVVISSNGGSVRQSFHGAISVSGAVFGNIQVGGGQGVQAYNPGDLTITVTVPPEITLDLSTEAGDVRGVGRLAGVRMRTSAGDIWAEHLVGDADMTTSAGNVSIESSSGHLTAVSSAGNIRANAVSGHASLSTSAGNIAVVADEPARLTAVTSAGNVKISGRYQRECVHARSSAGNVRYR